MDKPKVTPKDFFLWAGAMIALYGSVISFLTLLFQYINYAYPDPLAYYYVEPYSGGMRFAMATLIVLVPVTILLMRFIRNDIARDAMKSELWVRRWALVLTVFFAGFTVVGDLIALVNGFLGGDLTTRFTLKVLVVLFVAGGVFLHFLADLRGYWTANPSRAKTVGLGTGALVLVAIISGFFIMGTPGEVRLLRFDDQKVSDLQNIQWQIVNYWQQKEALPATIEELKDPLGGFIPPVDSQTGEPYEYRKTGTMSFELCATFNAESNKTGSQVSRPYPEYGVEAENWQHPAGEHCFERTIDPDRYPPYTKTVPAAIR
ncbi:hypothetical protein C4556_01065 [Candidatus Parcubacteria bacterium]|nr:MAG: hypothetical protein C4556_01065 [Candidatus Parcubacteria bacterium]